MTGLNSDDAPLANRGGHTRQESTSSDSAMLNNSKDRPTEPVPQPTSFPSDQTNQYNHGHEYDDPYYRGADRL